MRDFYSNLAVKSALDPAVQSDSVDGVAIQPQRLASGVVFVLATGAIAGAGAFSAKLQESANGTDWTDVPAKWVQSNAPAVLAASSSYRLGYTGKAEYVRLSLVKASGTSIAASAVAVLRPLVRPVA